MGDKPLEDMELITLSRSVFNIGTMRRKSARVDYSGDLAPISQPLPPFKQPP